MYWSVLAWLMLFSLQKKVRACFDKSKENNSIEVDSVMKCK